MALEIVQAKRMFKYDGIELPDPLPGQSTSRVLEFYSGTYPELTNAKVTGPEIKNDVAVYEFDAELGEKG